MSIVSMEEALSNFRPLSGISLQDCIYKMRAWMESGHKSAPDYDSTLDRLSLMAKFLNSALFTGESTSPDKRDLENNKTEQEYLIAKTKEYNFLFLFSCVLDLLLHCGRKEVMSVRCDVSTQLKRQLPLVVCAICFDEPKGRVEVVNMVDSLNDLQPYRHKDISSVLKQLRKIRSSQLVTSSDTEKWTLQFESLLERQKKENICGRLRRISDVDSDLGDADMSVLKKRKYDGEGLLNDSSYGSLPVYRVCYLIEALCKQLKLHKVVQQLAQEIFQSFIIFSYDISPLKNSRRSDMVHCKSFENYLPNNSIALKNESSLMEKKYVDLTIRHFTEEKAAVDDISDFWLFWETTDRNLLSTARGRECERSISSAAVAAILVAHKVLLDTANSLHLPRVERLIHELRKVLRSPYLLHILYDNVQNAVVSCSEMFRNKVFKFEKQFLLRIQYDVTCWQGTIFSTLEDISKSNAETITKSMVQKAASIWNERVWWFTNVCAKASKVELGLCALVIANTISSRIHIEQWCHNLHLNQRVIEALVVEMKDLYKDFFPALCQRFNFERAE